MLIVYVNPVAVYSFIIDHQKPYLFFKLQYVNKEIDGVNISYILNHKKVQSCVPQFFFEIYSMYFLQLYMDLSITKQTL